MSAPRPVAPVVGMEFYFRGEAALHTIARITSKRVYYAFAAEGGAMFRDCSSLYYWMHSQAYGDVRPVLWTVGPKDSVARLGIVDGDAGDIALWPTRDAALAAGRAFGWERPVARRVVRR